MQHIEKDIVDEMVSYAGMSVTERVRRVQQPKGGYIPASAFMKKAFTDDNEIFDIPPAVKSIQGMAADYITRKMIGTPNERAFKISLMGAAEIGDNARAVELLAGITGTDDTSLKNACLMVGYDVVIRNPSAKYHPIATELITPQLISNVRVMADRTYKFLKSTGSKKVCSGFTLHGGYNQVVSSGDGDYLTDLGIYDLKTSPGGLTQKHTLQLAMYYAMGVHSTRNKRFSELKELGIFNAYSNTAYTIDIDSISDKTFHDICCEVVGYSSYGNSACWRTSTFGTNCKIIADIVFASKIQFDPWELKDGIHDISIDEYWGYYSTKMRAANPYDKPIFPYTEKIKLLKNSGYLMFTSVSHKGKLAILHGGKLTNLPRPIEYYYDNLPDYAENIAKAFTRYWDALYSISRLFRSLEMSEEYVHPMYERYLERCMEMETVPLPFERWAEGERDYIKLNGNVHGCIVDIDFSNHIYLNPFDGTVVPYSASSMFKHVYASVEELVEDNRPEMSESYGKNLIENTEVRKLLNGETIRRAELTEHTDTSCNKQGKKKRPETRLDTSIDMYSISNRIKVLQMLYNHRVVAAWHEGILKNEFTGYFLGKPFDDISAY